MSFDYFLGANTPNGFYSAFSSLTDDVSRLYIIKGGPGSGKSTAMKRIADACESADCAVERIWCSSDPKSLDGVYIPFLDTLYVDGTAPHVVEPSSPGPKDGIVNFGDCWDEELLAKEKEGIQSLNREISRRYQTVYHYLRAAGELEQVRRDAALQTADCEKLYRRACRLISQHIPGKRAAVPGRRIRIFLSALTPDGPLFLDRFASETVCELHDSCGLYGQVTKPVMEAALAAGYTVYTAQDPFFPEDAPLHVIIPALSFALLTSGNTFGCPATGHRRIRLDKLTEGNEPGFTALQRKQDLSSYESLLHAASDQLREAKRLHDELEAFYRPAVDFSAVDALTERHIERLFDQIKRKKHDCRS